MTKMITTKFRVRNRGGTQGGKEISFSAPEFIFDEFIRSPNVEEFIKKAYDRETKKIAREIENKKSHPKDLQSYESIIYRALKFTRDDVKEWLETRDWNKISHRKNPEGIKSGLFEHLPKLTARNNHLSKEISELIAAEIITELADNPDPIGEFLYSSLTIDRKDDLPEIDINDW